MVLSCKLGLSFWEPTETGNGRAKIIVHKTERIINIHGMCSLQNGWNEANGVSGKNKLSLSQ